MFCIIFFIDHRHVPYLQIFFKRHAQELPITSNAKDYQTGNIVTRMLPNGNLPHIGIIIHQKSADDKNPFIKVPHHRTLFLSRKIKFIEFSYVIKLNNSSLHQLEKKLMV